MIDRYLKQLITRFGIWRMVQIALASCTAILFVTATSQYFVPIHFQQSKNQANAVSEFGASESFSVLLDENTDKAKTTIAYRSGMFKPATGLQTRPLANKTIERIKGQLKLQCVMEINGELVAYINIQGVGLRKCGIGDTVNDLFTVLDIHKQNKSVDISIVDHKVSLHL